MPFNQQGGGGGSLPVFTSTLGANAASIDTGAGAIPGGFNLLEIHLYLRTTQAAEFSSATFQFNNDSGANYARGQIQSNAGTVTGASATAATSVTLDVPGSTVTASYFASAFLTIPNYAGTTGFKLGTSLLSFINPGAPRANVEVYTFSWANTAAITRFAVTAGSGNLLAGSACFIYVR